MSDQDQQADQERTARSAAPALPASRQARQDQDPRRVRRRGRLPPQARHPTAHRQRSRSLPTAPVVARRTYDEAVRQALIVLWEAADRICGKRLKAVLPEPGRCPGAARPSRPRRRPSGSASSRPAPRPSTGCWPRSAATRPTARSEEPRPSRARRSPSAPSRTRRCRRRVTWRSTSSPTAAAPCRGCSCGAWWRRTSARAGPRRSLWWPGSSPWSSRGWR